MSSTDGKLEFRTALKAYQTVVNKGRRDGERHDYDGLTAETSFDGYTIRLSDGTVTALLLFHSRMSIEAPSSKALEAFIQRVKRLAAEPRGSGGP